jgi:SAM-dependent methyltransferase
MSDFREYTERNRRAWNEIAEVRERKWPGAAFFAAGGSLLDERVRMAVGDVTGKTLLHLQCATGEETLSWAVAGAVATGADISDAQIALAARKAADAGLAVRFVAADIYDLPADLQVGAFDIVYTGGGALVWLPDIARWAGVVAAALKPGGRLILDEEHPVAQTLWVTDGKLEITTDYFGRGKPEYDQGWSHFAGGEGATETKAQFAWPLGDIVTALARAGLRIASLEEYPSAADWRFGELLNEVQRLPGHYLLVATKERS